MKKITTLLLLVTLFFSCSHKKQLVYLDNVTKGDLNKINLSFRNNIEIGDILKIDIVTVISEASTVFSNIDQTTNLSPELMLIQGYEVDKDSTINYPILGKIKVVGYTISELTLRLKQILIDSGQLKNPKVKINKINSKFTVLGEVKNPGTFFNYDNQLNIFQAIGLSGDLLISGKRNNVKLIREENGLRKIYKFSLNNDEIFDKPFYYIKSNDVIIVEPNYSKIKSAGFIGSPASIASFASLVLSVTLLLINK